MKYSPRLLLLSILAAFALVAPVRAQSTANAMDAYIRPYVNSHNFAGSVLVTRGGTIVFDRAYGFSDIDRHIENKTVTSYHIASLSMAYTAALVLHLIDKGRLSLDNTVGQLVPGAANGARSVREVLQNGTAEDYQDIPRLVEAATGTSFDEALSDFLFTSHWMTGSGLDDGDLDPDARRAKGYLPDGSPAPAVLWRQKAGGASAYTTTRDELRFVEALLDGDLLKPATRALILASGGYGWGRDGTVYEMAGQAGGFSAFVSYAPQVTVIVLGNIQSDASAAIGRKLAGVALERR